MDLAEHDRIAHALGTDDYDSLWNTWSQQNGPVAVVDDRSLILPGIERRLVDRGIRSAADRSSVQYLKLLIYGTLNTIASFNDPEADATRRCATIESAIAKCAQIPHWEEDESEMLIVMHDLWLMQEPDYYTKTRIHGRALFPVHVPTGQSMVETTAALWGRLNPHVWEISPGGSNSPMAMEHNMECTKRLIRAVDGRDVARESACVRASEPVRMNTGPVESPDIGDESVLSMHANRSMPNDPVYENLFQFLTPLPISRSDLRDRRVQLRIAGMTGRRLYIRELLRRFVNIQCKFDLNSMQYAFLVHANVLPDHSVHVPLGYDPHVFHRRPIWSYTDDSDRSTRSTPFRSIEGYGVYNSVLDVYMRMFAETCYPFVLDPIVDLVSDPSWLESFPLTREEVEFMILVSIDETFHTRFYDELYVTGGDELKTWIDQRKRRNFMSMLGELNLLVQHFQVTVPDHVIVGAWNTWTRFNEIGLNEPDHVKTAFKAAQDQLKHIRRLLPGARSTSMHTLPSVMDTLHGIRSAVMTRWYAWTRGYGPFREMNQTLLQMRDALRALPQIGNPHVPLIHIPIVRAYANALCNGFAMMIANDATGMMLAEFESDDRISIIWGDPVMVRPLERYSHWMERTVLIASAIASAMHLFRTHVLEYVYYAPFMRATMGRIQHNRTVPYTYASDCADELKDLLLSKTLRYSVQRGGAEHVVSRNRSESYMNDPYSVLLLGMPWHRKWTGASRHWRLRINGSTQTERSIQPAAIREVKIPDHWTVHKTESDPQLRETELLLDYEWAFDYSFHYSPPDDADIADFSIPCHVVISGTIPMRIECGPWPNPEPRRVPGLPGMAKGWA